MKRRPGLVHFNIPCPYLPVPTYQCLPTFLPISSYLPISNQPYLSTYGYIPTYVYITSSFSYLCLLTYLCLPAYVYLLHQHTHLTCHIYLPTYTNLCQPTLIYPLIPKYQYMQQVLYLRYSPYYFLFWPTYYFLPKIR